MGDFLRIVCVTSDLSGEGHDLPREPGIILAGSMASVKIAARLFGDPVEVVAVLGIKYRADLLRRCHDAMSRREPNGISDAEWDQLLKDIEVEINAAQNASLTPKGYSK